MRLEAQTLEYLADLLLGEQAVYYRSRSALVSFFNELGWNETPEEHIEQAGIARRTYVLRHLREVNGTEIMKQVLLQTVDPRYYTQRGIEVQNIVDMLNEQLAFDGYTITKRGIHYHIQTVTTESNVPLPTSDQLLASAVRFLIDGDEDDAAQVLLACTLTVVDCGCIDVVTETNWHAGWHHVFDVLLAGPRSAHDILTNAGHVATEAVSRALMAVLPAATFPPYIRHFRVQAEVVDVDPDWRAELLEIARGRGVTNQLSFSGNGVIRTWNNLRFRSQSEVRIAEALDRAGVLFLPNCMARLTDDDGRKNREADFLVCAKGKWGIFEVDGEPFHPPSRTVHDHARDRLFRQHGIRVVEHFDANECYNDPDATVAKFLSILDQS